MSRESEHLRNLITGMRDAFQRGDNAMAFARAQFSDEASSALYAGNLLAATLIAYDLQAGSYTAAARAHPKAKAQWCEQIGALIALVLPDGGSVLEVGVGEATTLAGVITGLGSRLSAAYGFDVSWSRIAEGRRWLAEARQDADLFVADLFHIPLADDSIDVVYSSHSLEPNRGRECEAIAECLRVARTAVVLVEPLYELASPEAQARMDSHGYVRGLREAAITLGATVIAERLLKQCANPLNPSGVLLLHKGDAVERADTVDLWKCPVTGAPLIRDADLFFAPDVGIAYPVLRGIPMLRPEHAIVASSIGRD
ncbi:MULTISPECIES: methyltransferase domain-containing protein [unclassified Thiocapsa]|uniref:methyltransferase domain-containing protein n=1 Tax=unclassified Thiocapsa TaxID=2641286 RepID=UPI0035B33B54